MKPEEQRIAIAEWCGWNTEKQVLGGVFVYHDPKGHIAAALPDYLNDLNAMHDAEGKLQDDSVQAYEAHLNAAISKDCRVCYFSLYASDKIWNATAKHRAEALLRTIGRWTDSTLHTKG